MSKYNLGFISDENIFSHVKKTIAQYRYSIDLNSFNTNIIDPIKLTFDSKVYNKTLKETIEAECIRQIDKTNSNNIGYFHQNIFKYAGNGWTVPENGVDDSFDVTNHDRHIFCEVKNKHNTMNSSSSQKTYIRMQNKILKDDKATCYLVEVIAKQSQNIIWKNKVDGTNYSHERIRRISMDRFYELVFGQKDSFMLLCKKLPEIIDDVLKDSSLKLGSNTVFDELNEISPDTLKGLYLLAFRTYEGFENL